MELEICLTKQELEQLESEMKTRAKRKPNGTRWSNILTLMNSLEDQQKNQNLPDESIFKSINYYHYKYMSDQVLHRQQTYTQFQKIFEDVNNRMCVACSNQSREWCSVNTAIFMCLNCASSFKDVKESVCLIKSVNLDMWNQSQIKILKVGGNTRFIAFMQKYKLNKYSLLEKLCTRAGLYYRQKLQDLVEGRQSPCEPNFEEGRQIVVVNPINSKQQKKSQQDLFEVTKLKLGEAFDATKSFTKKTASKIEQKWKSPQFQKDLDEFGEKTKAVGRQIKEVSIAGLEKAKLGITYTWEKMKNLF